MRGETLFGKILFEIARDFSQHVVCWQPNAAQISLQKSCTSQLTSVIVHAELRSGLKDN